MCGRAGVGARAAWESAWGLFGKGRAFQLALPCPWQEGGRAPRGGGRPLGLAHGSPVGSLRAQPAGHQAGRSPRKGERLLGTRGGPFWATPRGWGPATQCHVAVTAGGDSVGPFFPPSLLTRGLWPPAGRSSGNVACEQVSKTSHVHSAPLPCPLQPGCVAHLSSPRPQAPLLAGQDSRWPGLVPRGGAGRDGVGWAGLHPRHC